MSVDTVPFSVAVPAAVDPTNQLSMVNACNALNPTHAALGAPGNRINGLSAQLAGLNPATCVVTPANNTSTGENLFSTQDVENLVRFGGLKPQRHDVIQIDPPQAYGIVQYARTLDMLARHQWPRSLMFPHGGNQMSLAIAAGFGLGGAESYPGVFGDFGGFADDAALDDGYLKLSDRPGIGFEGQARLYRIMRELAA